jgi:hypothetical protein
MIFFSFFSELIFFENGNLNFLNLYAEGFAIGVVSYAEGRATLRAIETLPREIVAEEICRGRPSA